MKLRCQFLVEPQFVRVPHEYLNHNKSAEDRV